MYFRFRWKSHFSDIFLIVKEEISFYFRVVVRLGSTVPFSQELNELQEEVKPLWKMPSCPRDFKRTSVEILFREAEFRLDWCSFRLVSRNRLNCCTRNFIYRNCYVSERSLFHMSLARKFIIYFTAYNVRLRYSSFTKLCKHNCVWIILSRQCYYVKSLIYILIFSTMQISRYVIVYFTQLCHHYTWHVYFLGIVRIDLNLRNAVSSAVLISIKQFPQLRNFMQNANFK